MTGPPRADSVRVRHFEVRRPDHDASGSAPGRSEPSRSEPGGPALGGPAPGNAELGSSELGSTELGSSVLDAVAVEEPLEIRLEGAPLAVVMRTPGDDVDLVRGFLLTEGIVLRPDEVRAVVLDDDGRADALLRDGVAIDPEQFRRNLYSTSSCGVCGKASIDSIRIAAPPLPEGPVVAADRLAEYMDAMREEQMGFSESGGLHAAAAFTSDGNMLAVREDVGRHNAMDKLVGYLSMQQWPLGELTITVSGRVSFELVQKVAVAGLSVIAGVSAASSLAVDLADELGLTVAGFVRPGGFNIYTHEHRIA